MKTISGAVMAAVVLTGCGSSGSAPVEVSGTWQAGRPDGAFLTLEADGSLHGNDGCNSFFGTWSEEGSAADPQLSFDGVGKTEMFCEGVDDWLSQLHSATVEDDGVRMHIMDVNGQMRGSVDKLP